MIITRTPYRLSFFGGGTDYPTWYRLHGGKVLASSIDKYCYISVRYLPPFFEHKFRIVYSKTEMVNQIADIRHPVVREALRLHGFTRGLEIHHDGDLPALSGVGSSSSFSVGILNALYALRGQFRTKRELALEAIHLEQVVLKENVGGQDQTLAAHGGLNLVEFHRSGEIVVSAIHLPPERLAQFESHWMLYFTGQQRSSSEVVASYVNTLASKEKEFFRYLEMVDRATEVLRGNGALDEIGDLLHEAWQIKRGLSQSVSTDFVDQMYATARTAGALGGKLVGAGGGGFMLLFVPPDRQESVARALGHALRVPFELDFTGSQIIYADHQKDYSNLNHRADLPTTA